jgi:L-histidine N-alpha-methyltransferase
MKNAPSADRLEIVNCLYGSDREEMKREVLGGLTAPQKNLPCKYFYDSRGSVLFERICGLPEYYQTRTELSILRTAAPAIMKHFKGGNLIELGSGANWKIRALLDAADGTRSRIRYVPVDVCEPALRQAAEDLLERYPDLAVRGLVADFHRDMNRIMVSGDRMITFFGSTMGNLSEGESREFLESVSAAMNPCDRFLVGLDLVKPKEMLEAAYNDAQGVTAEFNKNILAVVNRELNASFDLSAFDHVAFFNEQRSRVEMHLRANRDLSVEIEDIGLHVAMQKGETIFTEMCRKFKKEDVVKMAAAAGLKVSRWFTDNRGLFTLAEFMTTDGQVCVF